MRISKISLTNFRSHVATELDLPRIAVVRGANGGGKSSLKQAIELTLTGRCEGLNFRGEGAPRLIHTGADKATVLLHLSNGTERRIRCSLTPKSGRTIAVREGDQDVTAKAVQWLNANRDVLACLTNTRHFVDLAPADQKALLAGIILPDAYEWPTWAHEAEKTARIEIDWGLRTMDLIPHTYDIAYKARTGVSRALRELRVPDVEDGAVADVDGLRESLRQLEDERTELVRKQERRRSAIAAKELAVSQAKLTVEIAEKNLADAQRMVSEQSGKVLDKKALESNKKLAAMGKEAAKLEKEIVAVEANLVESMAALAAVVKLETEPVCPTCSQAITTEVIKAIAGPVIERNNAIREDLLRLKDQRASLNGYELAQNALDEHKDAENDVARAQALVKEAESRLNAANEASLKADAEMEAAELESAESLDSLDMLGTDATIASLNLDLGKAHAAEERRLARERLTKQRDDLTVQHANLERLIDYFGPNGIQAELLSKHVGEFEASMNAVLEGWGYHCKLVFDPYAFTVVSGSHSWDLNLLSRSEQYRFAIAFQVALASASGMNFTVVDEADMLDDDGYDALMGMLMESELDQAIVLGTDTRTEVPKIDGVGFFLLASDRVNDVPTTIARSL